ncbi:hypothetical protein LLG46_10960 [bacterium]|nr:hypothetical protein [bacterium]
MNLHRTFSFAVLIVMVCALAAAAGVDVLSQSTDVRLDQKVDFDADGLHVSEALGSLAQNTGVPMAAGVNDNDWMVRDRRIIVHVKAMPLRNLMREISSILHFDWITIGSGTELKYAILQTEDQAKEEQSLRDSAVDAQAKQLRTKRENVLAEMSNLGSLGRQDAATLANTDPWKYVLASEPLGRSLAEFLNSSAEARNAFLQGTSASFPVSQLSTELQATVQSMTESYDSLQQRIGASDDHSDLLRKFDKLQVTINRNAMTSASAVMAKGLLGSIEVGTADESIFVPVFDPSSSVAKSLGRAIVRLQSGLSKEEVGKLLQSELQSNTAESGQPERDITSDPSLKRAVALYDKKTTASLADVLKSLALRSGLNIISDCLPCKAAVIASGSRPLGEQLEIIRKDYGSNWEKSGNTLRLRDSEWFIKRSWEVPRVWIEYWADRGKANNGLLLEDMVQIAKLRDSQIDHTIINSTELAGMRTIEVARNRDILRFYASLNYDQQKDMAMKSLAVSSLSDNQWALLQKALIAKDAEYAFSDKGTQAVQLIQTGTDLIDYKFEFIPGPDMPIVEFKLSSGIYGITDNTIK